MAGGGTGGTLWIKVMVAAAVLLTLSLFLHEPGWLHATILAIGGLLMVFASCESMVLCVDGIAKRSGWNPFVAGTMGGLASNLPEVVMLGFVLAAEPRIGFIVVMFTLHVGSLAFGIYSLILPRDADGHARLPAPLVRLSTDLYACAAGVFLTMGLLMLAMYVFAMDRGASDSPAALSAVDLYVTGGILLLVEIVAIWRLVVRFSGDADGAAESEATETIDTVAEEEAPPSRGKIVALGLVGIVAAVWGGHGVGEFAEVLVHSLRQAGYSEMVGALVLSIFACAGAYAMAATAHSKGMYNVALASVSGAVTQVPFVVLPFALLMIGAFSQLGISEAMVGGGALPIDMQTTTVVLLGFPPLLILWKAVQDDAAVNWLETVTMMAIFSLTIYFLAVHG
jgi:hypothetical protein